MRIAIVLLLCAANLFGGPLKAGVGKIEITPTEPVWMSGYAARTRPSNGVLVPLWAKALAVESSARRRMVIVTIDVVGIPGAVTEEVAMRARKQYGLERAQLVLNASHTHAGPMVWPNLRNLVALAPEEQRRVENYTRQFADALVKVIGAALTDLAPATISYGEGSVNFARNRRLRTDSGIKNAPNPDGPVDHGVPVLRIVDASGKVRAILFAYACHNTTLGADIYSFSGDYAGYAALALEAGHSGATALFLQLCGADQNPYPRGTVELTRQHGEELAAEVGRVISGPMAPVEGPIRSAFRLTQLKLVPRTREDLTEELNSPVPANARRAELMLQALKDGKRIDEVEYPIAAVRFGRALTLIALGGEVTVDYSLRVRREYPGEPVVAAGYSNDVMCYIPSARVLREGGYEARESMAYYGLAGPFAAGVEDRIFAVIRRVMADVGR